MNDKNKVNDEQKKEWQKPKLEKVRVSLDTRKGAGSGSDALNEEFDFGG